MKRLCFVLGTSVLILPWLGGTRVQAEAIQWSASVSMFGPNVNPGNGGELITSQTLGPNNWNASIGMGPPVNPVNGTNSQSLGSVWQMSRMFQVIQDKGDMNHSAVINGQFLVAGGDTPPLLEPTD